MSINKKSLHQTMESLIDVELAIDSKDMALDIELKSHIKALVQYIYKRIEREASMQSDNNVIKVNFQSKRRVA